MLTTTAPYLLRHLRFGCQGWRGYVSHAHTPTHSHTLTHTYTLTRTPVVGADRCTSATIACDSGFGFRCLEVVATTAPPSSPHLLFLSRLARPGRARLGMTLEPLLGINHRNSVVEGGGVIVVGVTDGARFERHHHCPAFFSAPSVSYVYISFYYYYIYTPSEGSTPFCFCAAFCFPPYSHAPDPPPSPDWFRV